MRLSALHPLLVPLCCGILSVASPGITSNTAGPGMTLEAVGRREDGFSNYTIAEHNISIAGLPAKDLETQGKAIKDIEKKNVVITQVLHLKLECSLVVDSIDVKINVSWRHGKEQISSNLYTSNITDKQWRTTYEFVVTDANKTGNYMCIFSSASTEVRGTFSVQVPSVHGGTKAVVSYNGDFIVLKCDTSSYKPLEWLWYRDTENEQVALNFSADPQRYDELSEKRNETKLRITGLTESDSGSYVCKAVFKVGESTGHVEIKVLSYMVPLKVFLIIAAEVVILVAIILVYEVISKKKNGQEEVKKEYEQMSQLKSDDSIIAEASTTRQRKV